MLKVLWLRLKSRFQPRGALAPRTMTSGTLERRVQELQNTVKHMSEELATVYRLLAGKPVEIRVDKILVDRINLDQLVFNIDEIDVDQLSGVLSIGVNSTDKTRLTRGPGPKPGEKKTGRVEPGEDQTGGTITYRA